LNGFQESVTERFLLLLKMPKISTRHIYMPNPLIFYPLVIMRNHLKVVPRTEDIPEQLPICMCWYQLFCSSDGTWHRHTWTLATLYKISELNHCGELFAVQRIYQPGEDKFYTKPLSPTTLCVERHWKPIVQCIS